MARYLFVCRKCHKQVDKIFHHLQDVPITVPCPQCGQPIGQFRQPAKVGEAEPAMQGVPPAASPLKKGKKRR